MWILYIQNSLPLDSSRRYDLSQKVRLLLDIFKLYS